MAHSKKKKSTKTASENDMMVNLEKTFKTIILKIFNELEEYVEKINKMIYDENKGIDKEKT